MTVDLTPAELEKLLFALDARIAGFRSQIEDHSVPDHEQITKRLAGYIALRAKLSRLLPEETAGWT